jgi:hypothetical protein
MNRRIYLKNQIAAASIITTGGILLPQESFAIIDPFTGTIVITLLAPMVSSITALMNTNKTIKWEQEKYEIEKRIANANLQDEQRRVKLQSVGNWLTLGIQANQITYKEATDAYARTINSLWITDNLDGSNTIAGIKQGALFVERGGYGGSNHGQAVKFMTSMVDAYGRVPVPTSNHYLPNRSELSDLKTKIANSSNMSDSQFEKDYGVGAVRPYSLANKPTSNADIRLVAVYNKEQFNAGSVAPIFVAA